MQALTMLLAANLLNGTDGTETELQGRWKRPSGVGIRLALDDLTGEGGALYSQFILSVAASKELEITRDKITFQGTDKKIQLTLTVEQSKIVAKTDQDETVFH